MANNHAYAWLFMALAICCAAPARAEPAAIVEATSPSVPGIQPMDLLQAGQKIELSGSTTLTLGYFRSCLRERITGGVVTIGSKKSSVSGGTRQEEAVDCSGGSRIISGKKGAETAGAVFRKGPSGRKIYPKPDWTLYGTAPLLRFTKAPKNVRIERLDRTGETPINLDVSGGSLDTASTGVTLDPGGLYSLSAGENRFILKISPLAVPDAPLLSRLVPM